MGDGKVPFWVVLLLQAYGEADGEGYYEEEEYGDDDEYPSPAPTLRDLLVVSQRCELLVLAPDVVAVAT